MAAKQKKKSIYGFSFQQMCVLLILYVHVRKTCKNTVKMLFIIDQEDSCTWKFISSITYEHLQASIIFTLFFPPCLFQILSSFTQQTDPDTRGWMRRICLPIMKFLILLFLLFTRPLFERAMTF